jgi:4'-phosphopantetheinyl transferase
MVPLDEREVLNAERLSWLDDAERERAARFYASEHAERWRVAHVALRGVLAEATGLDPQSLRFGRDANDKPTLLGVPGVGFNLSHSGSMALVAVTNGSVVGVDVEDPRPVPEMQGVAESHFATEEQEALWAVPDAERLQTFYRIWTRKEAYVKATGVGIGPALARFAVTADEASPRLLYAADTPDVTRWKLHALPLPSPFVGALCVADTEAPVQLHTWRPR